LPPKPTEDLVGYRLERIEEEVAEIKATLSSATRWLIGTATLLIGNLLLTLKEFLLGAHNKTP
jgi:hypothetical protein